VDRPRSAAEVANFASKRPGRRGGGSIPHAGRRRPGLVEQTMTDPSWEQAPFDLAEAQARHAAAEASAPRPENWWASWELRDKAILACNRLRDLIGGDDRVNAALNDPEELARYRDALTPAVVAAAQALKECFDDYPARLVKLAAESDAAAAAVEVLRPDGEAATRERLLLAVSADSRCLTHAVLGVLRNLAMWLEPPPSVVVPVPVASSAPPALTHPTPPPAVHFTTPAVLFTSWGEILAELGLKSGDKRKVVNLHRETPGPIVMPPKGGQPRVERNALLAWWNGFASRWEELKRRRTDRAETLRSSHRHGRDGTVLPDISGSVKRRRKDRKS
jgi:hypothetical protein